MKTEEEVKAETKKREAEFELLKKDPVKNKREIELEAMRLTTLWWVTGAIYNGD